MAETKTFKHAPGKTFMAQQGEVPKKWWLVNGDGKIVGRMATEIAMVLMGKHRPTYTPHVDCGDFVVVTNCEKVALSGTKWEKKEYNWYTGYQGLRVETAGKRLARAPERILYDAVRRMLPKNKLGVRMLEKLKIYVGPEHPHQAQQPEVLNVAAKKKK